MSQGKSFDGAKKDDLIQEIERLQQVVSELQNEGQAEKESLDLITTSKARTVTRIHESLENSKITSHYHQFGGGSPKLQ